MKKGTKAVYKYFDLSDTGSIKIDYSGDAVLSVNGSEVINGEAPLKSENGIIEIEVLKGKCDIYSFTLR